MSSVEDPLIASSREADADADDLHEDGDAHRTMSKQSDNSPPGLFIWLLTFSAGISGLLFGCEYRAFSSGRRLRLRESQG